MGVSFLVLAMGCKDGDGKSGGAGSEADRAALAGVSASTMGSDNTSNKVSRLTVSSLEPAHLDAIKDAGSSSYNCEVSGTISPSANETSIVSIDKDSGIAVAKVNTTSTATNCGPSKFSGTITAKGDVTINTKVGTASGAIAFSISGSTSKCSSIKADLASALDYSKSSDGGSLTLNGNINGTCSGGSASCTFDNVKILSSDTETQARQKLCEVCGVTPPACI